MLVLGFRLIEIFECLSKALGHVEAEDDESVLGLQEINAMTISVICSQCTLVYLWVDRK